MAPVTCAPRTIFCLQRKISNATELHMLNVVNVNRVGNCIQVFRARYSTSFHVLWKKLHAMATPLVLRINAKAKVVKTRARRSSTDDERAQAIMSAYEQPKDEKQTEIQEATNNTNNNIILLIHIINFFFSRILWNYHFVNR